MNGDVEIGPDPVEEIKNAVTDKENLAALQAHWQQKFSAERNRLLSDWQREVTELRTSIRSLENALRQEREHALKVLQTAVTAAADGARRGGGYD